MQWRAAGNRPSGSPGSSHMELLECARPCAFVAVLWLAGCASADDPASPASPAPDGVCSVTAGELVAALAPDAIVALSDPPLVGPGHTDAAYLEGSDRVVGVLLEGEPIAVPLNVLRFHEVVNLSGRGPPVAVTYCPLTGSSLVFDRSGFTAELGVSGLLRLNNLVMFDRSAERSLFSQMGRGAAICGPAVGSGLRLEPVPSIELTWEAWRRLHPDTRVVSERTGQVGPYDVNPYVAYEEPNNPFVLVAQPIDSRRPPKERVLGIPAGGDGGFALPFGELAKAARRVITLGSGSIVVLWDAEAEGAGVFSATAAGQTLTFELTEGRFVDRETGSVWRLDGRTVSGPLAGSALAPIADAYVAFWFAWAAFHPETVLWRGP